MDFYSKEFYDEMVPPEDEDCLYLNVWTPADAQPGSKLPVLFWIHGGAFMHGCGSEKEFDGEGMARKGVILVTVNYRVNVFGFFAHPDLEAETPEHVSGNYGILDQLFALKWVRENIAAFGGDPDKVDHCRPVRRLHERSGPCVLPSLQRVAAGRHSPKRRRPVRHEEVPHQRGDHPDLPETYGAPGSLHHRGASGRSRRTAAGRRLRRAGPGPQLAPPCGRLAAACHHRRLAEAGAIHDIPYMIGSTGNDIGDGKLLQESGAAGVKTC